MEVKEKDLKEKTISTERIYDGKMINLRVDTVELPNKKESKRETVEHPGAVAVIAINDENEILMIKQFRYAIQEIIWEIPAGKLEKGENPDDSAERELVEETGYKAKDIKQIARFYTTPGFTDEVMYLYIAKDLIYDKQNLDEDEFVIVEKIHINNAVEMIYQGRIIDSKTIIGILMAKDLITN